MKNFSHSFAIFALIASLAPLATLAALMDPATPESQGVPSEAILKFLDASERTFDASWHGSMHGIVIVRHGRVIAEGSWKPFDTLNETHMLYSHSKSFTSSAIGILVDSGKLDLDERLVEIFSNDLPSKVSANLAQLRVRDLLTMNVGKEAHLLNGGGDWVKDFLACDFARQPGSGFKYDSDATYMLAAIVEKKSGMKMMDFLKANLFDKIGITRAWTTCSPQGIPCAGWGMNMTTREIARFGQLYLNRGDWNGERVLSPEWVALATARHTWSGWQNIGPKAPGEGTDWEQGYGFQFWRCRHNAYRADGTGGQYTVVVPDQDLVISAHAGIDSFVKELNLIWDYLLPAMSATPLPENPAAQKQLADRLAKLEIAPLKWSVPFTTDWHRQFTLKENRRGFKSVAFEPVDDQTVRCRLVTRCGEQTFLADCGAWKKGDKIRIDPENYEGLGAYIGEHAVAASYGTEAGPQLRLRAYLTGTPGYLEFIVDQNGKLTGSFSAMYGCALEGD